MNSKKKKLNFTKAEIKKVEEIENPDFLVSISIITIKNLKDWNLIDSKKFREYLKKQIISDFEGGDVDE